MNTDRTRRTGGALVALALAACLSAAAEPASAKGPPKPPRVVPLPSPPEGPKILRVIHDALRAVQPGDRVAITVLTEAGAKVTAAIGPSGRDAACSPRAGEPGAFRCEAVVPETVPGPLKVVARASDSKGRSSTLSAVLPVIVESRDPWRIPNAVNARLVPVFFPEDGSDLDSDSRAVLAKDAEVLKVHPAYPIVIEGHGRPGEGSDVMDLSRRRAEKVRDHLISLGIILERMKTVAMGGSQPVTASRNDEERAINRRVMVLLQPLEPPAGEPSTTPSD